MYSYQDWLVMRELALLLILVLLLCVSILMGSWPRRKQPSDTEGMVDQDANTFGLRKANASSALLRGESVRSPHAPRRAA